MLKKSKSMKDRSVRRFKQIGWLLVLLLLVAGCSQGKTETGQNPTSEQPPAGTSTPPVTKKTEPVEPVELVFYAMSVLSGTDEEKAAQYTSFVQQKYPHLSFKFVNAEGDNTLDKYIMTNEPMDLVFGSFAVLAAHKDRNFLSDMSHYIKQNDFDLGTVEQAYIDQALEFGDGTLPLLPVYDLRLAMYYSIDLFEKFGVAYPADGLTWEEALGIARQMTRIEGDTHYRGFATGAAGSGATVNQHSMAVYDVNTKKATLNTDGWKRYLEVTTSFFQVPSYEPTAEVMNYGNQLKMFQEGTAAMVLAFNSYGAFTLPTIDLNWDVATLPEMSDRRGVGAQPYPVYMGLAEKSKHPNEAVQAITALLSEEAQIARSAEFGIFSPLKSAAAKEAFGQASMWQGKNLAAFASQTPAAPSPYVRGEYKAIGEGELYKAYLSVILGEKDINTALREAEELANSRIQELNLE